MSQEFNQAAVVSGGRAAHGGNDGGTGAPPSNTAPDNSNPVFFQPLRWGIDSLYLSYPGELSPEIATKLRALKLQAQSKDGEVAEAQLQLGDHVFEVMDKSSGMFAFSLADGAYLIRLSASRSKKLPMAYVQVRSGLLAHKAPSAIEEELRGLLRLLGDVGEPKVSRVDLFVDFASSEDMEAWGREAWVTRASAVHQYAEDSKFTGWSIGAGGALMARLYLKLLECQKTGKEYLLNLWKRAGWDELQPVWRLEFQFKREVLSQLKLDGLPRVLEHLNGLWSYASTEWLKLCIPSETDTTRSRWPIHPLWMALASVDWETQGGPLSREFTATRAPSRQWIGAKALSLVASLASLVGEQTVAVASEDLLLEVNNALRLRQKFSGLSEGKIFRDLVAVNTRKYNLRINAQDEPGNGDEPDSSNPYYRAKQGL